MTSELDALVLDLCEWVAKEPRPYGDVMDAWRTSCPRLTVWEDSVERGYLQRKLAPDGEWIVELTAEGHAFLADHDRLPTIAA